MKTTTLILMLISTFFFSDVSNHKITSKYNCPITIDSGGRCTGSANCRICTNCSRCGYCNSGGSCGVCGGGSSSSSSSSSSYYYTTPKRSRKSTATASSYYYKSSQASRSYYEDEIVVVSELINLRQGPGLNYDIIEKIEAGDFLTVIEHVGDWVLVKVDSTGSVGYVYAKLLK